MIWVDWCILALLLVSVVVGLMRGFAREVLGLLTWVLAFWVALRFALPFDHWLEPHIDVPSVRRVAAYALLFFGVLLVGSLLTTLVVKLLRGSALSIADRTLGGGFGLLRGALLMGAFLLFGGMTPLKNDPWWGQSRLLPYFQWLAEGIEAVTPQRWLDQLQSDPEVEAESAPTVLSGSHPPSY